VVSGHGYISLCRRSLSTIPADLEQIGISISRTNQVFPLRTRAPHE
jgi:hypothetical protein